MRILTLSWEYPPLVYGGLGRHVGALSEALAAGGHQVTVVAPHDPEGRAEAVGGVRVVRAEPTEAVETMTDLLGFVDTLGDALTRAALQQGRSYDVVTAHDWVVGRAAAAVAAGLGLPLVSTLHATEAGRHQGWLPGHLSRSIHTIEGEHCARSTRIVVCSTAMGRDVRRLFGLPPERVAVIANGISTADWPPGRPVAERDAATLLFAGRLEYEKGVHVLLDALPRIRRARPGLELVVAGTGTYETALHELVASHGLEGVRFIGRVPDDELVALFQRAGAVVIPSLYEPFGLVALEAAACGAPLVVSDVGGLGEFAATGGALTAPPGDAAGLADAVLRLLDHPAAAEAAARAATARLARDYDWPAIARQTAAVLEQAVAHPQPAPVVLPEPGEGNLLA